MTALLSHFLIIMIKTDLKSISISVCEIIDHIVNTLSTDDMYSLANSQTLWQPIQM